MTGIGTFWHDCPRHLLLQPSSQLDEIWVKTLAAKDINPSSLCTIGFMNHEHLTKPYWETGARWPRCWLWELAPQPPGGVGKLQLWDGWGPGGGRGSAQWRVEYSAWVELGRQEIKLPWRERVGEETSGLSAPLLKDRAEPRFHGVRASQGLPSCLCVAPCVCLRVQEGKKAWVGLQSLKPEEALVWNASWVVLTTFCLLGASFTKPMVIFGLFLLVLKTVARTLPCKTPPRSGRREGEAGDHGGTSPARISS